MSYFARFIGGVPPGKPDSEIKQLMREGSSYDGSIERGRKAEATPFNLTRDEKIAASIGGPENYADGRRRIR